MIGPDLIRHLPDPPQDDRRITLESRPSMLAGFGDYRLERDREAIGGKRRRPMIVDDSASRGVERVGERGDSFDHVIVYERLQLRRRVSLKEAVDQHEQLRLPLAKVAHAVHEQSDIALLLANGHGGRMLARGSEVRAVGRTRNLNETLGAAADGANLPAEGRAAAPGPAYFTQRTNHVRSIV